MNTSEQPLQIIYIASSWRSGSTLLDQVLGSCPRAFGSGELKSLERFAKDDTRRDDQGYSPQESPMWSRFATAINEYLPPTTDLHFRFSVWERLYLMMTGNAWRVPHRYQNEKLYADVQAQAATVTNQPVQYLIDSSKPLYRVIELNERTDLDVFVIHLVRDVRGVVYSHQKQTTKVSRVRAVWTWLLTNLGLRRYIGKHFPADKRLRVQYEDLVADPERVLGQIQNMTGLTIDLSILAERINTTPSYRFSGNQRRQSTFTGFFRNEQWRTELPRVWRILLAPLNWLV